MTDDAKDTPTVVIDPEEVGPLDKEERMWGMFCHLAAVAGHMVGIPAVGPLVVWALKKDEYPFVDKQGKESMNFQISVFLYMICATVLMFAGIGFLLIPAVEVFSIICVIVAAVKANDGIAYKYPLCIRFIK